MIVHGTGLPAPPADRDELVQLILVDEVAGVMLPVPSQAGCQTDGVDRHPQQDLSDLAGVVEGVGGELTQPGYQLFHWNPRQCRRCVHSLCDKILSIPCWTAGAGNFTPRLLARVEGRG